jgi:branched-subunit amino acid aminotransferase/4-amino-4-deoxychorismate lyase
MSVSSRKRWIAGDLVSSDDCDVTDNRILVADSWLVTEGRSLALELHRRRFLDGVRATGLIDDSDAENFWNASIASIPRSDDWFPRVELAESRGAPALVFWQRSSPERHRSVVVATHAGPDPRTQPAVKGPDLAAMLRIRTEMQPLGAGEAVILSKDGFVVEGAYSAVLWWHGDALCVPSPELVRVDSVTARSILALATALGVDVLHDSVTPDQLDGLEVWSASALHGIRILTEWVDGPTVAELPGRLATWRSRLARLRSPLPG